MKEIDTYRARAAADTRTCPAAAALPCENTGDMRAATLTPISPAFSPLTPPNFGTRCVAADGAHRARRASTATAAARRH
eukprot:6211188-Pleurochrysis_carterae.AAC.5